MLFSAVLFLLGIGLWTFVEYLIHGVLSHRLRGFPSRAHGSHHRNPRGVFTSPRLWMPTAAAALALFALALGLASALPLWVGLIVGFALYELFHWHIHFRTPRTRWGRRLRAHHLAHHHVNPRAYYGVTTRLWDHVLGTLPESWHRDYARVAGLPPSRGHSNFARFYLPWRASSQTPDETRRLTARGAGPHG
ncbi:MAG: sterol desaturase family protein [Myxococcales bacterium]|nr:sterol desaturase family protein [Myxococcales bacterium]MCB9751285.1 sterol desaturase family protein [Myxococcales bacterium]